MDLYRCSIDFGSYKYDVGSKSEREAERLVKDHNERQIEDAIMGDQMAQEDLSMDLNAMASCEKVEDGNFESAANVEDGFVFKKIDRGA